MGRQSLPSERGPSPLSPTAWAGRTADLITIDLDNDRAFIRSTKSGVQRLDILKVGLDHSGNPTIFGDPVELESGMDPISFLLKVFAYDFDFVFPWIHHLLGR